MLLDNIKEKFKNYHIILLYYNTFDIDMTENYFIIILKINNDYNCIEITNNIITNQYISDIFENTLIFFYNICPTNNYIDIVDKDNTDWYLEYEDYEINGSDYILYNNLCYNINNRYMPIYDNDYKEQIIYGHFIKTDSPI